MEIFCPQTLYNEFSLYFICQCHWQYASHMKDSPNYLASSFKGPQTNHPWGLMNHWDLKGAKNSKWIKPICHEQTSDWHFLPPPRNGGKRLGKKVMGFKEPWSPYFIECCQPTESLNSRWCSSFRVSKRHQRKRDNWIRDWKQWLTQKGSLRILERPNSHFAPIPKGDHTPNLKCRLVAPRYSTQILKGFWYEKEYNF